MRFIRKFENFNNEIEVGDYVIIGKKDYLNNAEDYEEFLNFLNNNYGIVTNIIYRSNRIVVKYNNIPDNIKKRWFSSNNNMRFFDIDRVIAYGKTKEELDLKLSSEKYKI